MVHLHSVDGDAPAEVPLADVPLVADTARTIAHRKPQLLSGGSVDDWGRDPQFIAALRPLVRLRWQVSVGGQVHLSPTGAALLVANARRLSLGAVYSSLALAESIGRPVRFVGRPDIAPLGPLMRRLGGLLRNADEVACALRNGEIVLISAASTSHPRHAGWVDPDLIASAVLTNSPVYPVATISMRFGRATRVEIGPMVPRRHRRRGPLAEVELAADVQRRVQKLLEEFGGSNTGVGAIDWLREG